MALVGSQSPVAIFNGQETAAAPIVIAVVFAAFFVVSASLTTSSDSELHMKFLGAFAAGVYALAVFLFTSRESNPKPE